MAEQTPFEEYSTRSYLKTTSEPTSEFKPFVSSFGPMSRARAGSTGARSEDQDLYDVTIGAATAGAADFAGLALRNLGQTIGSVNVEQFGKDLEQVIKDNPDWRPTEVESAIDLLTNPKAISSRLFGQAPYLLATVGLATVPYAGIFLAAGLAYAVESQRAYEEAVDYGASERDAVITARISGTVNSLFTLVKLDKFFTLSEATKKQLAKKVVGESVKKAMALNLGLDGAVFAAREGVVNALQGGVAELIPKGVYGKELDGDVGDFIDRRLQDAIGGVLAGSIYGSFAMTKGAIERDKTGAPVDRKGFELDRVVETSVIGKEQLARGFALQYGVNEEVAYKTASLVDGHAKIWGKNNNANPDKMYTPEVLNQLFGVEGIPEGPLNDKQVEGFKERNEKKLLTLAEQYMDNWKIVRDSAEDAGVSEEAVKAKLDQEDGVEVKEAQPTKDTTKSGESEKGGKPVEAENKPKKEKVSKYDIDPAAFNEIVRNLLISFKTTTTPEMREKLNSIVKSGKGKNKKTDEDKQIQMFGKFMRDGVSPNPALTSVFIAFRSYMKDTYTTLKDQGIKTNLPNEVKFLFDKFFVEDNPTIDGIKGLILENDQLLKDYQKKYDTVKNLDRAIYNDVINDYKKTRVQLEEKLLVAQDGLFDPRAPTEVEVISRRLNERQKSETPVEAKYRGFIARTVDSVGSLISTRYPILRFESGREFEQYRREVFYATNAVKGQWEEQIINTWNRLSRKDVNTLLQTDELGQTVLRRLFDGNAVNPLDPSQYSDGIKEYGKLIHQINRTMGIEATKVGVMVRTKGGKVVPFTQAKGGRVPRILTADARKAMTDKSGPLWDAIKVAISKANVDENGNPVQLKDVEKLIETDLDEVDVRKGAQIEFERKIKVMPDVVELGGKKVAVVETDLLDLARKSVEYQARRVEWIRRFGQGAVKTLTEGQIGKVLNAAGFDGHKITKERLIDEIAKKLNIDPNDEDVTLSSMKFKELKDLAEEHGVGLGWSRDQLIEKVLELGPQTLKRGQQRKIISLIKEFGGVQTKDFVRGKDRPFEAIFEDFKNRVNNDSEDLFDYLQTKYVKEGGDSKDLLAVAQISQGIPYGHLGRSAPVLTANFVKDVLGAMQTSLAAVVNIPQTLVQVPQLAGLGNYLQAINDYVKDKRTVESDITAFTGMQMSVLKRYADPGYGATNVSQTFREFIEVVTGQRTINDINRYVSGQAFRLKAETLRTHGVKGSDVQMLKALDFTEQDIQRMKASGLTDLDFKRIVQAGIGKTQIATDDPVAKGKLENLPLAKMVLSYSSYIFGTTRSNYELVSSAFKSLKSGSSEQAVESFRRLSLWMVGNLGAGTAAVLLKQAIRGAVSEEYDENKLGIVAQAFHETGALGVTTRLIDGARFDNGSVEKYIFSMAPQASAIVKFMGALAGMGRFGELPLLERAGLEARPNFALLNRSKQWMDKIVYPELQDYEMVSKLSRTFKTNILGMKDEGFFGPVRADYYNVGYYLKRGDGEGVKEEVRKFVQTAIDKGEDPIEALKGLRQSMMGRSPIGLATSNKLLFLRSLPKEKIPLVLATEQEYKKMIDAYIPKF